MNEFIEKILRAASAKDIDLLVSIKVEAENSNITDDEWFSLEDFINTTIKFLQYAATFKEVARA